VDGHLEVKAALPPGKEPFVPTALHRIRSERLGDEINHFSLPGVIATYISRNKIFLFEVLPPSHFRIGQFLFIAETFSFQILSIRTFLMYRPVSV
jgi:hypothetical protein